MTYTGFNKGQSSYGLSFISQKYVYFIICREVLSETLCGIVSGCDIFIHVSSTFLDFYSKIQHKV